MKQELQLNDKQLERFKNTTLAKVCDGMSVVSRKMSKETTTKKQKQEMLKHAEQFKALGKVFRALNKRKK